MLVFSTAAKRHARLHRNETDMNAIMAYDLLSTPGLVIDEKRVSSGRIPTQAEIIQWLSN